jgi:serine/threonine protein kinase
VLHRDIKPANILVNRFGMVGLSDFGLASIISVHGEQTASREALTPAYSSPETFGRPGGRGGERRRRVRDRDQERGVPGGCDPDGRGAVPGDPGML